MFYDVELLNRRGGKFGVVWLVANNKLQLTGTGSRKNLRIVDSVIVCRSCEDVLRYLLQQLLPDWVSDPKSRLSLYLSGMLVHGISKTHSYQVKLHYAVVQRNHVIQTAERTRKDRNPNLEVLNLSNDSFHLDSSPPFNVPLPEVEFERLAAVSTALGSIAGSQQSQEQLGTIEESEEDLRLAGDRNNLETDVDFANAFQQMGIGRRSHFVEERAITLQDVDPVGNPMEELQQQMLGDDLSFGPLPDGSLFSSDTIPLPATVEPMDIAVDEPANQGVEVAQPDPEQTADSSDPPAKRSRTEAEPPQQQDPRTPQLELEPVGVRPINRRGRRLIIDPEIYLPAPIIKHQIINFADLMRQRVRQDCAERERTMPVAVHLIARPSRNHLAEVLRNRFTRNMITRPAAEGERAQVAQEDNQQVAQASEVLNELEPRPSLASPQPVAATDNAPVMEPMNIEINDIIGPLAAFPNEPPLPSATETMNSEETLRHPSGDASYAGSLSVNASKVDVSGSEKSIALPNEMLAEKLPALETVEEASVENSRSTIGSLVPRTRSVDEAGRLGRPASGSVAPGDAPERANRHTGRISRPKRSLLDDVPEAVEGQVTPTMTRPTEVPFNDGVATSQSIPKPTSESSVSSVNSDEMLSRIEDLLQGGPLTFRKLVPPATSSKRKAASTFLCLLGLVKDKKLNLTQEQPLAIPYTDIYITFRN